MADESNDTLDRPENTDADGFPPATSEVAAPEPTQEPLEGPDVELPTGEPSPAATDEAPDAPALPEPLEGPDVELPTGGESPEAPVSDEARTETEPDAAPEPDAVPEAEPGPVTAVSLGLLPEVFVSQVSTQLLFYAPEIAPLPGAELQRRRAESRLGEFVP